MDIVIAGAHGKVARHLARLLAGRGDAVRGIIRSASQAEDVRADGAEQVVLDLEAATVADVAGAIRGAGAVVFAAGAGPGSGAARKWTVDHGAAVKVLEAARSAGVGRYVIVSAMGTDDPPAGEDVSSVYLRAKARADEALMASDLAWTIVRPGGLTVDPPTGRVRLGRHVDRGQIPRADVAAVLAAVLHEPRTAGHVIEVVSGDTPIPDALARLLG
jgi:nucleoside-diphosphate-sugar epimerase